MVEKPKMDDPLTVLLADAPKQSLVNLLVQLDSARSAVRRECLNFLNKTPPCRRARKSRLTVNGCLLFGPSLLLA